jgi:tetratricopeptide (TPR) repeat protein
VFCLREIDVKIANLCAAAALFMVPSVGVALAVTADDLQNCNRPTNVELQIASCTRALTLRGLSDQQAAVLLSNRGNAWSSKGEYRRAMNDFNAAIRAAPEYPYAYYNRAIVWSDKLNLHESAIADFSEFIRLSPNDPDGYAGRAEALYKKQDYAGAINDFNEAIRLDPTNSVNYGGRGGARRDQGELDLALVDFNEALRLSPTNANVYNGRGFVWKEKGEIDRALADYAKAISLNPKLAFYFHNNRGVAWSAKGEFDLGIAEFNEAVRIEPRYTLSYSNRGETWRLKGDLDRALADQSKAVQLDPKGVLSYARRGDILRYKGDFLGALADYARALVLQSDYLPALVGRALTYERTGDLAKARKQYELALASKDANRVIDVSKAALETARARLAALDVGIRPTTIPASLPKAKTANSIPTPTLTNAESIIGSKRPSLASRRIALVIGNSAYMNVPRLPNPQRDAEAIAASLRNVGFDAVTLLSDSSREKLIDGLRAFANDAEAADWAMVYYAGHGLEVGGVNYLVPVDARISVDRDIQFEAVPLDQVLVAMEGAKKLKIVMLDACRNSPFTPRKTTPSLEVGNVSSGSGEIKTRSIGRGLAEVKVTGATLVVYAAKHGQVALDGEGGNSPFAVAVAQRLAIPGIEINKLFRLVRDDVMEATAGRQEPYTYGSLPGKEDFFFVEK